MTRDTKTQSDSSGEESSVTIQHERVEGECPLCGEPYVHKYEYMKGSGSHSVRDDFEVCTQINPSTSLHREKRLYVHDPELEVTG